MSGAPRALRIFVSTGEPSAEMLAIALAEALRRIEPAVELSGVGGERMAAAGFALAANTRGWASMGPLSALGKIPKLYATGRRLAAALRRSPPSLVVLIDFGAFHVRLARWLRAGGYRAPLLYLLPPAAWLDREGVAREVARLSVPLTAFEHQRDFYASLGLEARYFGHPLVSLVEGRAPRPVPPPDGGTLALLPGSRAGELAYHLPRLLAAVAQLRRTRARMEVVIGYADSSAERTIRSHTRGLAGVRLVAGAVAALDGADAALVASGTAVLEAALRGVPAVALYVVSGTQARIGRRMYRGRYVTLPNLVLGEGVVPELLQEAATPERLAREAENLLRNPGPQLAALGELRAKLGPPDALDAIARFALELARGAA